ncbi:ribosomal-protein-alanine acetyltransferase [compost metagenome]
MLLGEALPGEAVHPRRADGRVLLGYLVAMPGVDEVHLLNITVAPAHQRQGWARFMLDALALWSRSQGAQWLWLEVRASNAPARALYEGYGFQQVGMRRGYYPASHFQREDAVVMSLNLVALADGGGAA